MNTSDEHLRVVNDGNETRIIEPDGRTSVSITRATSGTDKPFKVQYWTSSQEIRDASGNFVARTTDPEMARHICKLLIAFTKIEERKAAGELPK